jgi:hypothetical protein
MQNAGAHGHLKRTTPDVGQLRMLDSLGAPTEWCLSKIAHRNDRASRGVDTPGTALRARCDLKFAHPISDWPIVNITWDRKESLRGIFTKKKVA